MYLFAGFSVLLLASAVCGQQQQPLSKTTEKLTGILLKATSEDRFNYVASPFAGSVILAIAAEGARGDTKSQLVSAMGGELPDKSSYKDILTSIKGYSFDGNTQNRVVLKNFLYVYKNYSVLDSFAELARDYYLADVRTVARPSLEMMRTALSQNDAAADFDDSADDSAFNEHAMLIFNGLSLELNWPTSTWHKTSVQWNGKVIQAFGAAGEFAIGQVPSLDSTVFRLPYKNTNYALMVFLPKNKDSSLDVLLEKLPETNLEEVTESLKMKPVFVTMPCFYNTNITYLKSVLQEETEVKNLFTDAADLSALSSDRLFLDDVVQQASVRVCIDGSSSHSLTSSAFTSQRVIKESVVVDRPFVYVLHNVVNNVVYVAGKTEQPVWDEAEDSDDSEIEVIKM